MGYMKIDIKTKLTLAIGLLVSMIIVLVGLSVVNLRVLTATDSRNPEAWTGLNHALTRIYIIGSVCIVIGVLVWIRLPKTIDHPISELASGIRDIVNYHYDRRIHLSRYPEFSDVEKNFNRMAKRLADYHAGHSRKYWPQRTIPKRLSIASASRLSVSTTTSRLSLSTRWGSLFSISSATR